MQVSHERACVSVSFDEPNLVSVAGLLPVMTLTRDAGLQELADEWLSMPTDKGANAELRVASPQMSLTSLSVKTSAVPSGSLLLPLQLHTRCARVMPHHRKPSMNDQKHLRCLSF
jgi:hypothetical protein